MRSIPLSINDLPQDVSGLCDVYIGVFDHLVRKDILCFINSFGSCGSFIIDECHTVITDLEYRDKIGLLNLVRFRNFRFFHCYSATIPSQEVSRLCEVLHLEDNQHRHINKVKSLPHKGRLYVHIDRCSGMINDRLDELVTNHSSRFPGSKCIVFFNSIDLLDEAFEYLNLAGAVKIHSQIGSRELVASSIKKFLHSHATTCAFATKMMVNGIDLSSLNYVIFYDHIPEDVEMIQAVGRVRKMGVATILVSSRIKYCFTRMMCRYYDVDFRGCVNCCGVCEDQLCRWKSQLVELDEADYGEDTDYSTVSPPADIADYNVFLADNESISSQENTGDVSNQSSIDVSNHRSRDVSNQSSIDLSNQSSIDLSNHRSRDVSNQSSTDVSNQSSTDVSSDRNSTEEETLVNEFDGIKVDYNSYWKPYHIQRMMEYITSAEAFVLRGLWEYKFEGKVCYCIDTKCKAENVEQFGPKDKICRNSLMMFKFFNVLLLLKLVDFKQLQEIGRFPDNLSEIVKKIDRNCCCSNLTKSLGQVICFPDIWEHVYQSALNKIELKEMMLAIFNKKVNITKFEDAGVLKQKLGDVFRAAGGIVLSSSSLIGNFLRWCKMRIL